MIPNWCVTSLEVDFNVEDEKRLVGRGAFGRVVEGKWWSGDGAADEKVVAVKAMYVKTDNEGDRKRAEEVSCLYLLVGCCLEPHLSLFEMKSTSGECKNTCL